MPNPRIAKLEGQIQQVIAQMLNRRIKDPRLGFVTLTQVRLTGDAREATVFYTVLGDGQKASAAALESAKGLLRSTVAKTLGLKFAPTLTFVLDATEAGAKDMEDLLDRVSREDVAVAERAAMASYAGEVDPYKHDAESDECSSCGVDSLAEAQSSVDNQKSPAVDG